MTYETSKTVALFGGSFNPPTLGHEAVLNSCLAQLLFDEVWLMPSKDRLDKTMQGVPDGIRLAMLQTVQHHAFSGVERLIVTDFELSLPGLTETAATMQALAHAYPNYTFWNVYGADSYTSMPEWHNGAALQRSLNICVVNRHGNVPDITNMPNAMSLMVNHPYEGVSSTLVREQAALGNDITSFVSSSVAEIIHRNHLYESTNVLTN